MKKIMLIPCTLIFLGALDMNAAAQAEAQGATPFCFYRPGVFQQASRDHDSNEDFFKMSRLDDHAQLCSVYDGHGGPDVAKCLSNQLHSKIFKKLKAGSDPQEALQDGYRDMDNQLVSALRHHNKKNADLIAKRQGSTAVTALVTSTKIFVANTGDSRAVMASNGRAIPLSVDHKPDFPAERQRILAAGGIVEQNSRQDPTPRINRVLAISRSFGDYRLLGDTGSRLVIAEPDIHVHTRTQDDQFLIIASDGLWDVLPNELAVKIVNRELRRGKSTLQASQTLVLSARRVGSEDDITAIVCPLKHYPAKKEKRNPLICCWLCA